MTQFKVQGVMSVSCWTIVEAESAAEAVKIAKMRDPADHHIDGSSEDTESWHFDNDGAPHAVFAEVDQ